MLISSLTCFAQDRETNFNRIADELISSENEHDESNNEVRYENLTLLLSNPVDLNKIPEEGLRQFYFLSESQIQQFIKYRAEQGEFLSVYELQAIPGFDQNAISILSPLVKVIEKQDQLNTSLLKRMVSSGNSYLITRWEKTLEQKEGFSDSLDSESRYQGSDQKILTRFRSAIPFDYSTGFTLEKDAGEQLVWNPRKRKFGGDYSSAHVQLINKGRLKNLILGDYQAQFAQGLVLGGAFGLGKGAETITTIRRTNLGFTPHTSAGEAGFYRGAAASYQLQKHLTVSGFLSKSIRDASLTPTESDTLISAFQYSGMHRNEREKLNERTASEIVYGSVLHFRKKTFDAGIIFQGIEFQHSIEKTDNVYNQFLFQGKVNYNGSVFYNYTVNNFCLFGEAAKSFNGGNAMLMGVLGSLTPALDVSMLYRNYSRSYYSFYANPFSENTQPQNEVGFYWGFKYRWSRRWTLAAYLDLFRFPWLGFRRYAPTNGNEWLTRLTFQPSRKMTLFIQARQENKMRNVSQETIQYMLNRGLKSNYWASFNYAEGVLRLRTRIQYSTYHFDHSLSDGIVLLQGLGFEFGKFQVTAHYALFQTDDFDNRQYVYENDVYLVFSLPSYDGNGVRSMLMAEYKLSKKLTVYARFARSYYADKEEIGTGLELIKGNTKNDVKFQALLRF
jgi:hypothetical protein